MNEEKIKEIVAPFIKVSAQQIDLATRIDRSAVQSSILLHRMYARLAEEGLVVGNYTAIRVFGDLVKDAVPAGQGPPEQRPVMPASFHGSAASGIGIDIEEIAALPRATDFRKDPFYTMNFTPAEVSYCILQPDAYASFAGVFAAKEAIVKADNQYRPRNFNTLEIERSAEGIPQFTGFVLSISHAGGMAVAVAMPAGSPGPAGTASVGPLFLSSPGGKQGRSASWLSWIALLLAVSALVLALK
ncbi:MAG TPA: 4'-phosphopantetheinyl transferase superfamily protein [Puia sp.]|nr:4'-phosphopantetheinyl transferase superfamily protein [Puia sp.]